MKEKISISVFSSADKIKGQGVGSAYEEQINLVNNNLGEKYDLFINKFKFSEINHYHTIDFLYYATLPIAKTKGTAVGYVHFLPETMDDSLKFPKFIKYIFYKYMIAFYNSMDVLVTVNPDFIDLLADYNIDRNKIKYIPNFVSESKFYKLSDELNNSIKEKYNIDKDKFTVLAAGQLQTRKGVSDFIEIAKRTPNVQFVWAGGFSFGPITDGYSKIKKMVSNPPANVKFLGIVDRAEMNDIYNMADLMFLPSYSELFPMTILEAMNCGKPILLRDIDIYNNILFDFYLKGTNNDEFINVITKLASDKEYYNQAAEASNRGHKFYSEENVANTWDRFYSNLVNNTDYVFEEERTLKNEN